MATAFEKFFGMMIEKGLRIRTFRATLGAAFTVAEDMPPVLVLDPGGAGRDVNMPVATDNEGRLWIICNSADAAEDLTIKNSGGSTIGTISQNEAGLVMCAGGAFIVRLVGTST